MVARLLLALFVVCGCAWSFLTGDFMTPWLLSFAVVPATLAASGGLQ